MSLQRRLSSAVDRAFMALDDLKGDMYIDRIQETYDPSTGDTHKRVTRFEVEGVFDEYSSDEVDGTVVQVDDRRVLVKPVAGLDVSTSDILVDRSDNSEYRIENVQRVRSYNTTFLFELRVRR